MKKNPILCLLLALAMMVSLTACQIEIPGIGTVNINDGSNTGSHAGDDMGSDHTIHTGNDNDDSLTLLRKNMAEVPDYIFAAAYIGSAAGGPDDFELPIQEWVSKAAPELCALLGNALDNAIEGAAGAEDRTVRLRARADKGLLMLRVENALGRPVKRGPDGAFVTTKGEREAHGFGLAGMEEIARRRGGSLEAKAEGGRFQLTVCLPLDGGN